MDFLKGHGWTDDATHDGYSSTGFELALTTRLFKVKPDVTCHQPFLLEDDEGWLMRPMTVKLHIHHIIADVIAENESSLQSHV